MISILDAAVLCVNAYRLEMSPRLSAEWRRLTDCSTSVLDVRYFSACYLREKRAQKKYDVVFVHGFEDESYVDINCEQIEQQYLRAAEFVEQVLSHLCERHGKDNLHVTHTGYARGALIAEIFAAADQRSCSIPNIFTFDSLGARASIEYLISKGILSSDALHTVRRNCLSIQIGTRPMEDDQIVGRKMPFRLTKECEKGFSAIHDSVSVIRESSGEVVFADQKYHRFFKGVDEMYDDFVVVNDVFVPDIANTESRCMIM